MISSINCRGFGSGCNEHVPGRTCPGQNMCQDIRISDRNDIGTDAD